jgi:aspartyl protease family protein
MDSDQIARLSYLVLLLAAVAGWVFVEFRGRFGHAARAALAWGLIFVGLAAGYALWQDVQRDASLAQRVEGSAVVLPRAPDGHYYLTLDVGGIAVEFLVDTGATAVVLTRADARRIGIDPAALAYEGLADTANGTVRTARVTLPPVRLEGVEAAGLGADVTEGDLDRSLLGMEFLGRYRIEIAGDRMILHR